LVNWVDPKRRKLAFAWLPIMNSGPNSPSGGCSLWSLWWDAKAIMESYGTTFYASLLFFANKTGNSSILRLINVLGARDLRPFPLEGLSNDALKRLKEKARREGTEIGPDGKPVIEVWPRGKLNLGKIACKFEAAGKVRLFAMETWWIQGLLYPVHKGIFEILRRIPQDGTYDQGAPLILLTKYLEECTGRGQKTYFASFDLKAATDRIPVSLQEKVIALLLGVHLARCWKMIMVRKPYSFAPLTEKKRSFYAEARKQRKVEPIQLRYAVGQPMGAYSSWAMLALTHHCLVQFAAWRTGHRGGWYPHYAVLGDDLVIVGRDVAREYQAVAAEYGIGIGLAKSLISENGSFEFAKRFYWKGKDCSPLSAKEFAVGLDNMNGFVELARRAKVLLPTLRLIDVIRS